VRAVIDRRKRQVALAVLDAALGRPVPPPAPPTNAIVSLQCLSVGASTVPGASNGSAASNDPGAAPAPTGATVTIDGESILVRDLHVSAIRPTGDGPIDVYLALAALFVGTDRPPPRAATELTGDAFRLVRLDELLELDPFAGARWPLNQPDLVEAYPFDHHLRAFVDTFRRRYLPQRGRL
jgi:hypothetical protein